MKILSKVFYKTKQKTQDCSFVGCYIPTNVAEYLALHKITIGESKTSVLSDLLIKWVEEMEESATYNEMELTNALIRKIMEVRKEKYPDEPFGTFLMQVRYELAGEKDLSTNKIDQIIKQLEDAGEKSTKN